MEYWHDIPRRVFMANEWTSQTIEKQNVCPARNNGTEHRFINNNIYIGETKKGSGSCNWNFVLFTQWLFLLLIGLVSETKVNIRMKNYDIFLSFSAKKENKLKMKRFFFCFWIPWLQSICLQREYVQWKRNVSRLIA